MSNLPSWPGAERIYRRLYAFLAYKATRGWVQRQWSLLRGGWYCTTSVEMDDVIEALDKGDEETLKGLNLQYLDDIEKALQS